MKSENFLFNFDGTFTVLKRETVIRNMKKRYKKSEIRNWK